MLPISQATAGYLLLLLAIGAVVEGFALRWFLRRKRETRLVRRFIGWFRERFPRLWRAPVQADVLADEGIDDLVLTPTVVISTALACGGVFLLATDAFYIKFVLFR